MIKKFFLLTIILTCLNAKITLNNINSKPQCIAKDFMIWQYLKQDITPTQADKAYAQLSKKSNKVFYVYAKKTDDEKIKKIASCKKKKNLLSIKDKECLNIALTPYKTINLTNRQRENLSKKIDSKKFKKLLKIQNEPFKQKAYEKYSSDTVLNFFLSTSTIYRRKNLNIYFDSDFINKLSSSWRISKFIKTVVTDSNLNKLQLALLNMDGKNLNAQNNFFLGLNQLRHHSENEAINFFQLSIKKSKHQRDIDKNYFWIYQITKDKKYLQKLLLSMDINIYTLYAHEILNESVENYFTYLRSSDMKIKKDLTNPFDWNDILKEIKSTPDGKLFNLATSYKHPDMIPVQSFIIQKAYSFKMHGYIMPYEKYLKGLDDDNKALVYAIMRQESFYIPSAISSSYALGLMQLMPFLVDAIAKNCNEKVCYNDMFQPKNNIRYALKHIKWMKKSLYHPLFMAYAYNGGMGFLRRYIKQNKFTHKKYEPFLSMEMMSNDETREYGKRVLANYVMYKKIMGYKISIVYLFDTLMQPKKTDRFRQ